MTATTIHAPSPALDDDGVGGTVVATAESIEAMVREELAGEYRILEALGWGRWGMRFRVEDTGRAEERVLVALPAMDPWDAADGTRFLEALQRASLLDHPHLIPITGYGVSGSLRWFVIPVTDGDTLTARIEATGGLALHEVRRIGLQLASALDQAHRRGIAHGALGTNDILIDREGWVRLLEVGVAAGVESPPPAAAGAPSTGQGTDQVAFAGILRAALTGGSPSAPLPSGIPTEIEGVLRRATDPRPMVRFRDLRDLANALDTDAVTEGRIGARTPAMKGPKPPGWEEFLDTEELESPPPLVGLGKHTRLLLTATFGFALLIATGRSLFRADDPIVRPANAPEATPAPLPAPSVESAPPPVVSAPPPPSASPSRPAVTKRSAPPPRRTPRPTPPARVAEPLVVVPAAPPPAPRPGTLSVSSFPWGELTIDGQGMGNTPRSGIILGPGRHTLRISRDGYQSFETTFDLAPGATLRMTEITLKELTL
jgi:hypothetical protein